MISKQLLIADSGSTKTDWLLLETDGRRHFRTQGINPFLQSDEQIATVLSAEILPQVGVHALRSVYFYGAGCRGERALAVQSVLREVLQTSQVEAASDLLGAARALCGSEEGIACILGTGSNSCRYDGRAICENVSPLGFILGDEGSGAVLGRLLLGNVFKRQYPPALIETFFRCYEVDAEEVLRRVYREPFPNRYLASFAPFLAEHRREAAVRATLADAFDAFFRRNVLSYGRPDLPVHFVGSIARYFEDEVRAAAVRAGCRVGTFEQSPLEGLAAYHTKAAE